MINIWIAPSGVNLIALMMDAVVFLIFPVIGGLVNMSVLFNYEKDPITFSNSGLEKQNLYVQLMSTIKDGFFEIIGRTKFFDKDYSNETLFKPEYKSPDDTNLDEIYVPPGDEEDLGDLAEEVIVFEF